MFIWVIKQIIISLTLILLIHYLYFFFKTNLTVPKVKDLVNKPIKRYEEIYKTIEKPITIKRNEINNSGVDNTKMKDELKNYLKTLTGEKELAAADSFNDNYQTL